LLLHLLIQVSLDPNSLRFSSRLFKQFLWIYMRSKIFFHKIQPASIISFSYNWVEWFSFFEKLISPGVWKLHIIMTATNLFQKSLKFWDLPLANRPWRLSILKKKIQGRVKIFGWSKKQHSTFSGGKLLTVMLNTKSTSGHATNIPTFNMLSNLFGIPLINTHKKHPNNK
jgi:hypothetical protein